MRKGADQEMEALSGSGPVEVRGHREEESLLILINHCREMKQQEVRLRLITLLLLLGCAAAFIFISCADLSQRRAAKSSDSDPSFSAQRRICPADDPSTASTSSSPTAGPLRIDLNSVNVANLLSGSQLEWRARFGGGAYSRGLWAIVVPETGLYFVYMKFVLKGPARDFRVTLQRRSKGYDRDMDLMGAQDGGPYPTGPPDGGGGHHRVRTVYVGQLFDLWRGDQLKVLISEGQELIDRASFGAFRT
ncbi:uncharacterized protein LOC114149703 [Xiphophorus couchianus]|uniref:uncharacterized protein LOC114149047 n=1 Tax=Xiphophorus couchianus TaxID=32473 RepID=UPI0010169491|nr:uncharacterized protein LOC114149047 [Xiphophorus couchianus]XP_027881537.1 uncharacterized protein LOC114149703 [Xiphophorus couchianus]